MVKLLGNASNLQILAIPRYDIFTDGHVHFADSVEARFGAGFDSKISRWNRHIVNTTNDLIIWDDSDKFRSPKYMFNNAANDENIIIANENGAVELYPNNKK